MEVEVALAVVLERLGHHHRPEVGTADADVDNVLHGLAGVALPLARAHLVRERLHVVENALDIADALLLDVPATLRHRRVAESNVKHGAALGGVDVLALEHLVAELLNVGLTGEAKEGAENLVIDKVLGVVEENVGIGGGRLEADRVLLKALRVGGKEVLEDELGGLGLVELLELLPGLVVWDG